MRFAISSPFDSRAKWPASSRWNSSVFKSRLYGSAPAGGKILIVLSPHDQHRRLVLAEVFLPRRVQGRIAAVAQEQVELNLVVPLAVEQELIFSRAVGADQFRVLHAGGVLPFGRDVGEQLANGIALFLALGRFPVFLERLPEVVVESLVVGVAVLNDDGRDSLRMLAGQAIADRRAVVLHVQGILLQSRASR